MKILVGTAIALIVTGIAVGSGVYFGLRGMKKIKRFLFDDKNIFHSRWRDDYDDSNINN